MKFMLTILAMNLFVLASPKVINGDDMGIYEDEDSFNDLEAGKDLDDDQDADEYVHSYLYFAFYLDTEGGKAVSAFSEL